MTDLKPHEIYNDYKDSVFRVCFKYTKNQEEAEDLMQEAFIKIFKNLSKFKGDSKLFTWIYRVATNVCIDYFRAQKNKRTLSIEDFHEVLQSNLSSEGDDARLTLEKILSNLDENTREIIFLYHFEGLSHQEIGEVMGVSRVTVTKRLLKVQKEIQLLLIFAFIINFEFILNNVVY